MSGPQIRVGDEVRVFDQNGQRMGQPDGGWPGVVAKVGRKLATIDYDGRSAAFRLDSQVINDAYGHRWFRTLEQAERYRRLGRSLNTLKANGIKLEASHKLTLEQIEKLAELARTF